MSNDETQKLIDELKSLGKTEFAIDWHNSDGFTVDQAAYLWCGKEPGDKYDLFQSEKPKSFAAIKQMLIVAIETGTLQAKKHLTTLRADGDALVGRADLMALAESKKVYPAFLFDTVSPRTGEEYKSIKNKGGAPPEYDWDKIIAGVVYNAEVNLLPETLDALVLEMIEFVENGYNFDKKETMPIRAPAETTMKDRLRPIFNNLKSLGWKYSRDGNLRVK